MINKVFADVLAQQTGDDTIESHTATVEGLRVEDLPYEEYEKVIEAIRHTSTSAV